MNNYLKRKIRGLQSRLRRSVFANLWKRPNCLDRLNRMQELFCQWNAERLGISLELSRDRYIRSWSAISNGHRGAEFRFFNELSHDIFRVFFDDNEREVFDAYIFHGYMHFLRMLSYGESDWETDHPIVQGLASYEAVTILDFGCGLARSSWSLANLLKTQEKAVKLVLVDIPTIRKPFLLWVGEKTGFPVTFLDCTIDIPIPDLPPCHVCIATEVFEHLHTPALYLRRINDALLPGGFLLTNVADHKPEFLHTSPNLALLREELDRLDYEEIWHHVLFRKKVSTARNW